MKTNNNRMYKMKKVNLILLSTLMFISSLFAQDDEFFTPGGVVGGYGELHYNHSKVDGADAKKTLDFHRFVMFYSYQFNEKWSFKAELELEHNFVQGEDKGELELEQAFVDYHYSDAIGFRAGVVLVSAGLINEYHEPPTFFGVERPEYNKNIIPTTWFGNGAQFYGSYKGFEYLFGVMEGLNADKFSAKSGIRSGRMKGFKANAEKLLYNLRVDYIGVPGLRIGGSYVYNEAMGEINNSINLLEIHAKYEVKNLILVGEYGNISYDKGDVEASRGYYFDLGYNVADLVKSDWDIIPFVRYSDYNTAASTISGGDSEEAYHNTKFMFGVNVKPVDQVVFKFDYGVSNIEKGDVDTKLFNLGVGYMF